MKKLILLLLVLTVVAGAVFADFNILNQPPPLQGGAFMLDAGAGLRFLSWSTILTKMAVPPLFLQAEYALPAGVPLSFGAAVSYSQRKPRAWTDFGLNYRIHFITPHVRANWHWGFDVSWLDFYTGLSIGYDIVSVKWTDGYNYYNDTGFDSGLYYSFQAGAHFYFSQFVGVVVETGYPYWIKAGIAFKFGGGSGSSSSSGSSRSSSQYMLVNADTLNVRKGPSADTELVGRLQRNDRVQILEKPGQWWKIRSGRVEGYVNSSYLRAE